MSGTKSNFGQDSSGDTMNSAVTTTVERSCAASVKYKNVQGPCRRAGKYPDPDGIRWWCGLHKPKHESAKQPAQTEPQGDVEVVKTSASVSAKPSAKSKPKARHVPVPIEASQSPVNREVLVDAVHAPPEAVDALRKAQVAMIEISNTNTVGWDDTKPLSDYVTLINHMANRAKDAHALLVEALRQLGS